ncbi:MAG: energy-coupling factor transporter transmembrane protein EcfT [Coriobacteriales bacterium]|jgi:energy-coupling factor transport system permease protein|nr:energy-coupling factor transporter transmembrane protein EcfT [Coriobacteriales bacterium]
MKDTHPFVAFSFFVAVISLTMCASEPVFAALSLVAALLYLLVLKGLRPTLRLLGLAVMILLVVTVFNAFFVHQGMTVLFYLFQNPITLEATVYGISLGCMLAAVLMWFSCYQEVVGSDRFLALFSHIVPTTAMMVSMIFNFIPQVMAKARQIDDAHKAFAYVDKTADPLTASELPAEEAAIPTPAATAVGLDGQPVEPASGPDWLAPTTKSRFSKKPPLKERLRWPVRLSSILMGWSMETGLSTAASMRARAYGSTRRSSYLPLFWTLRDAVLLTIMAALLVLAIVSLIRALADFLFYPLISGFAAPWLYLPFIIFAIFPIIYEGGIRLKWRLSKF